MKTTVCCFFLLVVFLSFFFFFLFCGLDDSADSYEYWMEKPQEIAVQN